MPGRMLVNTGEVSLALDTQVVLRWRCLFPMFSRLSGLPWQAASNRNRQDQSRDTECEPLALRARCGVARTTTLAVIPAKAGIQYAAAPQLSAGGSGILD